jgi:hypothetical protein
MVRSVGVRVVGAVVLASLIVLVLAAGAEAKLGATLSASTAHSGDTITLTTAPNSQGVTQGGQPVRVYLLPGTTDPTNTSCQEKSARLLGTLTWNAATGVGTLSFRVPAVPPGDHLVEVLAPNAYPGCWPEATLTVVAPALPPTDTLGTVPAPVDRGWLLMCISAGLVGATLVLVRLNRGPSREPPPAPGPRGR